MIGALIGDIVGSRYERVSHKSKGFKLFDRICRPTDDSVMSLAVAKAILPIRERWYNIKINLAAQAGSIVLYCPPSHGRHHHRRREGPQPAQH